MSKQKENLLIHKLWQEATDGIHYMHVVNTDTLSHQNKSLDNCLQTAEREKSGSNWRLASGSAVVYPLLLCLGTASLAWRLRLRRNE